MVAGGEEAMGHSEYDPAAKERRPWNAGRVVGAKRALKPQQVWAIRFWLDRERRLRDRAMFDLAIDSKLRGCDVVKVRIGDLSAAAMFAHARSSSSRRQVGRFNLSSSKPPASAFWPGSNAEAERLTSSLFRAGSITPIISAPGNLLASLMNG
jgi:hypothetical protein